MKIHNLIFITTILFAGCSKETFTVHEYHSGDRVAVDIGFTHNQQEHIVVDGIVSAESDNLIKVDHGILGSYA